MGVLGDGERSFDFADAPLRMTGFAIAVMLSEAEVEESAFKKAMGEETV